MKLHLPILERVLSLPSTDLREIRNLLEDLVGEVKDIDSSGPHAVFNIETLANRGDHLSALGVAREISARLLSPIRLPPSVGELPNKNPSIIVRNNTEKCSRYFLMEMSLGEGLELSAEIRAVMGEAEDRPAIVNYLNYIQLEMGQPMHAFDVEKVEGEVIVELSDRENEVLALDGKSYKVPSGSILIKDRKKIIAVGGVIGCANTMVTAATRRVLIEAAAFDPVAVRLTARGMGISTDASYIFERGSDRESILFALKRLAYLTKGTAASVGGSAGGHVLGLYAVAGRPTEERKVSVTLKSIRREMNLPRLAQAEIKGRLQNLGYKVVEDGETLACSVPPWRLWDVFYEADVIEDFARSHGYNNIRLELPALDYEAPPLSDAELLFDQLEPVLLGSGFCEVITDSFCSADDVRLLAEFDAGLESQHIRVVNAVESSCSHLKVTNVLHFARLAEDNLKRGVQSVKVFEYGRLFGATGPNAAKNPGADTQNLFERDVLSLALSGRWSENEFRKAESSEELLACFSGVLEALLGALNAPLHVGESKSPLLHPGRQAALRIGRANAGMFGMIHSAVLKKLGLKHDVLYAELDGAALLKAIKPREFTELSDFPCVRRDMTLKLPLRHVAQRVVDFVEELNIENLERVEIVDDFRKQGENFRRASFRLTFQNRERTLESAEVDRSFQGILGDLRAKHSLELAC